MLARAPRDNQPFGLKNVTRSFRRRRLRSANTGHVGSRVRSSQAVAAI
jgi:hypothetical protein